MHHQIGAVVLIQTRLPLTEFEVETIPSKDETVSSKETPNLVCASHGDQLVTEIPYEAFGGQGSRCYTNRK